MENGKWKMENDAVISRRSKLYKSAVSAFTLFTFAFLLAPSVAFVNAQIETPPVPGAPKSVNIPAVKERKLPNGLTVAVIERRNVPLVTVQLLVKSGAEMESDEKAGLANMTASLLTKGTKTRTATQIAEQMEFLGGSINTAARWNNSVVTVNVMSDKLDAAMAIMSDVVLNPAFKQEEIDLLKTQTLDNLNYNLKQPGFLANYVAAKYSWGEHPAGGTPESVKAVTRADISAFQTENYTPNNAVLIFTGDITSRQAEALSRKYFGKWQGEFQKKDTVVKLSGKSDNPIVKRILVVDLPDSGQAAVAFTKNLETSGRIARDQTNNGAIADSGYFPALVLNSVLGGGYSSRLNQEIRIKRGLSYGAGSSFAWRNLNSNFATRTQTKNESAAQVAELVAAEIKRLADSSVASVELTPRKSVLTGGFGRNLETTEGLAAAVADLYSFGLPTGELNNYTKNVQAVSDAQIRRFAGENLNGGDIIIVGDYAKFKDDLAKRFPAVKIEVVSASGLDLNSPTLQKVK